MDEVNGFAKLCPSNSVQHDDFDHLMHKTNKSQSSEVIAWLCSDHTHSSVYVPNMHCLHLKH